jgi:hypothetical protein
LICRRIFLYLPLRVIQYLAMRSYYTLAVVLLFSFSSEVRAQGSPPPLLQDIYYTVQVYEKNLGLVEKQWWHQNLEPSAHHKLVAHLFRQIESGKLKVFYPQHPYKRPMTYTEMKDLLVKKDSVFTDDPMTGQFIVSVMSIPTEPEDISQLGFYEHWRYDSISNIIEKEVKGIVFYKTIHTEMGDVKGIKPLFYLPLNSADPASVMNEVNLVTKEITYDVRIKNPDPEMRESDWWYDNLEPSKRYAFVSSIYPRALKGQLKVHSPRYPFTEAMTASQVRDSSSDVREVYDLDINTGEYLSKEALFTATVFDMTAVRFHEAWYFDPVALSLYKAVKGFVLERTPLPASGEGLYVNMPAFYVPGKHFDPKAYSPAPVTVDRIDHPTGLAGINRAAGMDSLKWIEAMRTLTANAKDGRIAVLEPVNSSASPDPLASPPLSPAKLNALFTNNDTVLIEDLENPGKFKTQVKVTQLNPADVMGVSFTEMWTFDPGKYSFTKKTIAIEPSKAVYGEDGDLRGFLPLFRVKMQEAEPNEIMKPEYLLSENIEYTVNIIDNCNPFENTHLMGIWWQQNLEISKRMAIVQKWLDDAKSGKITVYDNVDHKRKLKKEDIEFCHRFYPPELGDGDDYAFPEDVSLHHVSGLRFHEAWYFDPVKRAFLKQVKGVTLIVFHKDLNKFTPTIYIPLNR